MTYYSIPDIANDCDITPARFSSESDALLQARMTSRYWFRPISVYIHYNGNEKGVLLATVDAPHLCLLHGVSIAPNSNCDICEDEAFGDYEENCHG